MPVREIRPIELNKEALVSAHVAAELAGQIVTEEAMRAIVTAYLAALPLQQSDTLIAEEQYAYGVYIDSTRDQRNRANFVVLNERSRRHSSMTEEERKQDDYDTAMQAVYAWREQERAAIRATYRGHRVED